MRSYRFVWVVALLIALSVIYSTAAFGDVQAWPTNPKAPALWQPVDFHLFSAPIWDWNADPWWLPLMQTISSIFPEPYHGYDWSGGVYVTPGLAHPPPYTHEAADGMKAMGFVDKDVFSLAEYSLPYGVHLLFMTVPNRGSRVKGVTPDGFLPMMPNSMYPMYWVEWEYLNGELVFYGEGGFPPPVNTLPGFEGMEGWSHWPGSFSDTSGLYPPELDCRGTWEYLLKVTEAGSDRGWWVYAKFKVK